MKKVFITYNEDGRPKKGTVNEAMYASLQANPAVTNLVVYPSELLMENNYSMMVNGSGGSRNILHG